MIDQLPTEAIVILLGIGVVVLLWLTLRFGKAVGRAVLVLGVLALAILGAMALTTQAAANYQTAKAATEAADAAQASAVGQSLTSVLIALGAGLALGLMVTITVGAVGTTGYVVLRWKLARRRLSAAGQRARLEAAQPGQVIYIVDEADNAHLDLTGLDLTEWGW